MGFLIVVGCCIVGVLIGGTVGNDALGTFGFFAGLAVGLLLLAQRGLRRRVDGLVRELDALKQSRLAMSPGIAAVVPGPGTQIPALPETPPPAVALSATDDIGAFDIDTASAPAAPSRTPRHEPTAASASTPTPTRTAQPSPAPTAFDDAVAWIKRWFTEGNVPVKIGMLVLFAGVAALLKYAADQGWLSVPIEFRLAGIAVAAMAALAFGWRERTQRRSFGLSLQGGAVGILLMTVFAAFRLYHLLPAGAAFGLLVVLVAGVGVLAVLQDSRSLAVLGILAGFAAPILISTGSGSHEVLFSYYTVLNLAIFAIAWIKPWRVLNLLGFAFTYAIGLAWGVLKYQPALFASTEPFLLVFFAIYLAVPILYARKREPQQRDIVDGSLVFGNPLIAFALQAALLDGDRMPLAYCAVALAAIYAGLAWVLLPRARMRVLGEAFAVLAVGFATLAVPLALSARASACTFALEGAGLVWLGWRQQRRLPRFAGLALQLLAAAAFVLGVDAIDIAPLPLANGVFIGAALIAVAGFASAWLYKRAAAKPLPALALYLWGLAWWAGAGLHEIDRFVPVRLQLPAVLGFAAITAALAAFACVRLHNEALAWTAAALVASGLLFALLFGTAHLQPFAGFALLAFALYAIGGWFALHALRDAATAVLRVAHIGWLWAFAAALAVSLQCVAVAAQLGNGWIVAGVIAPLLALWALTLLRPRWIAPPLSTRFAEWRAPLLVSLALAGGIAFAAMLLQAGDSQPLTWLPLFNPLELVQLGLLGCAARWLVDREAPAELVPRRVPILAAAAFAFVTVATLRAVHHVGGAPWDDGLLSSTLAQTSLTVVWSILGVLGWVIGSRRGQRSLWLAGAVLMGVVLVKLLIVDRTHLGNLFGIASFIAYGLLCTVIGYFAPAPPRAASVGAAA